MVHDGLWLMENPNIRWFGGTILGKLCRKSICDVALQRCPCPFFVAGTRLWTLDMFFGVVLRVCCESQNCIRWWQSPSVVAHPVHREGIIRIWRSTLCLLQSPLHSLHYPRRDAPVYNGTVTEEGQDCCNTLPKGACMWRVFVGWIRFLFMWLL